MEREDPFSNPRPHPYLLTLIKRKKKKNHSSLIRISMKILSAPFVRTLSRVGVCLLSVRYAFAYFAIVAISSKIFVVIVKECSGSSPMFVNEAQLSNFKFKF